MIARAESLERIDAVMRASTGDGDESPFPGSVVVVERGGAVAYRRAFGHAQTHAEGIPLPAPRAMGADTIFDLASLTKACVAAPVLMRLVADGRLDLDAAVGDYLPAFTGASKTTVTVRDLLTHRAGLWEWWPLYCDTTSRAQAVDVAARLELRYRPGARHYSDVGVILAGAIAEALTGTRIDDLAHDLVFDPLGLRETGYRPPPALCSRIAATSTGDGYERHMLATGHPYPTGRGADDFDSWRQHTLVGEVEDGNAHHAFEGVAAHAGLFSTADDVARFGRALLDCLAGRNGWVPAGVARTFLPEAGGERDREGESLVFWGDQRAELGFGHGGFGHSGFTGTQLFFEPATDLVVVMLTNRTHRLAPSFPYPSVLPAWTRVLRIVTEWVSTGGR